MKPAQRLENPEKVTQNSWGILAHHDLVAEEPIKKRSWESWIDLESVIQGEVSQKEKRKYCVIQPICGH